MNTDAKFTYILLVLIAIFIVSFGTLILTAIEQPQPLTFSHRWGICALSMSCDYCLEEHDYLNSSLSVCWEKMDMDGHIEIFGR